jgi:hypothetical protein
MKEAAKVRGSALFLFAAGVAAAYLTVEASDERLRQLFRIRGIAAAFAGAALELAVL